MADAERDLKRVEFQQPYNVRFKLLRIIRINSKVGYFKPEIAWNFGYEEEDFEKPEQVQRNIMEACKL